jgi:hypothetical protein
MKIIPITLREADSLIRTWHRDHRHHLPVRAHRFSLGLLDNERLVGAIIIGIPMARLTDRHQIAEVTRLAADGTSNACSRLLSAAAKAASAQGYARIQMFIEPTERAAPAFLKAAGFRFDGESSGSQWRHERKADNRSRRRSTPGPKHRWVLDFGRLESVTPGRRKCHGCGSVLPVSARPNKLACSPACRQTAYRKRRLNRSYTWAA